MDGDLHDVVALGFCGVPLEGPMPAGAAPMPLNAQARVVGGYQWVERRLFEVLGAWVGSDPVPEARVLFDVHSQQHAWHAELLSDRLPVLDDVDPRTLTLPPTAEVDRMFGLLSSGTAEQGGAGGTLLRLVGLGRVVLPRLLSGYALHVRRAAPAADAPVVRTLRLVMRDEIDEWLAIEAMVEVLVRRPHDLVVVTDYQRELEQALAGAGPGLVPWPGPGPVTPL